MGQPYTQETDFRWAEDVELASRAWVETQNLDLSAPNDWLDVNLRLVVMLYNSGDKNEDDGYVLQYSLNDTDWVPVTPTSNYVRATNSAHIVDGVSKTPQELGSGSYSPGFYDENGTLGSFVITAGYESESEMCVQFRSADITDETIYLRMAFDEPAALDNYTNYPATTFTSDPKPSVADAVSVSDSPEALVSGPVVASADTVNVADTPTAIVEDVVEDREIAVAESIALVDGPVAALDDLVVGSSEGVTVVEAPEIQVPFAIAVLDAVSVADEATGVVVTAPRDLVVADVVGVSDAPAVDPILLESSIGDAVSVGDTVVAALSSLALVVADNISVADAPTVDVGAEPPVEVEAADSIAVADGPLLDMLVEATASDAGLVAETIEISLLLRIYVNEVVSLADSPEAAIVSAPHELSVADNVSLADSPDVAITLTLAVSDAITVGDAPGEALLLEAKALDAVGVLDLPTVERADMDPVAISVADSLSLQDTPAATLGLNVVVADVIGVLDLPVGVASIEAVASEAVVVSEVVAALVTRGIYLSTGDLLTVTETVILGIISMKVDVSQSDAVLNGVTIVDVLVGRVTMEDCTRD